MIAGIDTLTLITFGLLISSGAYFMAAAMDGVMGPDGFGTVPNMFILIVGGFLGFYVVDHMIFIPSYDATAQALAGITGGFTCLAALATLKALANRFGY